MPAVLATRQTTPCFSAPANARMASLVSLTGWLTFIWIVLYSSASLSSQKFDQGGSKTPATGAYTSGTSPNLLTEALMRSCKDFQEVTSQCSNQMFASDCWATYCSASA